MTQIGESVGLALFGLDKPCPFCESKQPDPQFEPLELTNDAADLGSNMGGMPTHVMENPGVADYYIWENYWISADKSKICMNAHHVIPGNASLAKMTALQRWMAGTVTFDKVYYIKTTATKGKGAKKFQGKVIPGAPPQTIGFKLDPSKGGTSVKVTRLSTVKAKLVTGKVDYNVNEATNGEWLPSNNAVFEWSKVGGLNASDCDGDSDNFRKCYSWNAINVTGRQFHDAHPAYSSQVLLELGALAKEVEKRSEKCKNSCPGSQANAGSQPAPAKIKQALADIADLIRPKLNMNTTVPKLPWITSKLSIR